MNQKIVYGILVLAVLSLLLLSGCDKSRGQFWLPQALCGNNKCEIGENGENCLRDCNPSVYEIELQKCRNDGFNQLVQIRKNECDNIGVSLWLNSGVCCIK